MVAFGGRESFWHKNVRHCFQFIGVCITFVTTRRKDPKLRSFYNVVQLIQKRVGSFLFSSTVMMYRYM